MKLFVAMLLISGAAGAADWERVRLCDKADATRCATVGADGTVKVTTGGGAGGGLTDTQLRATPVPVSGSGTFDISDRVGRALGAVSVTGSVAVTGTFWQATQPVSVAAALDISDRVGRALGVVASITSPVAVTGTFWQATQPVSIASMPSTPVTGTFWQATQPVSGTFFQATQPVSLASLPALVAGTAVIGHVIADSGSTTAVTGNVTVVQPTGTNLHAVLDTTSTTACTQATGTNLHAVLDTTSTTAVTQATAANLNAQVIGGVANDTNNIANGAETQPAVARAGPSTVTAGRSEKEQIDTVSGGQYVSESPTTNNTAASQKVVVVNTTTNVKASAGNVYGMSCANANASLCFVQFYNTAGSPTCGTASVWAVAMPSSGVVNFPVGPIPMGNFATGIAMCMGTTATGATACTTANSCTIFFK